MSFHTSVLIEGIDNLCMEHICDMIKGNESDVANIIFEILAWKGFTFFCFILFSILVNCS